MNIIDAMMASLSLEAKDAGGFRRFLETRLGCLCELGQRLGAPRFETALVEMDGARVVFVRSTAPFELSWNGPSDMLVCSLVISGGIDVTLSETVTCRRGEAMAIATAAPWRAAVRAGTHFCALLLPKKAASRLLERLSGRLPAEPLELAAPFPTTTPIGRMLAALITAAVAGAGENGPLGRSPHTGEALEDVMLALLLDNLPHNHAAGIMRQRSEAAPWAVRKAIDFITAHARRDISVSEVAAAAGVSLRALQQNFQRSLKLSPQDYIKKVRLEGARRALRDLASPRSIEEIAAEWGFVNRGHFATLYRKTFGELPSQTRRSR